MSRPPEYPDMRMDLPLQRLLLCVSVSSLVFRTGRINRAGSVESCGRIEGLARGYKVLEIKRL